MGRPKTQVIESQRRGHHEWTVAATAATWEVIRGTQPIYIVKQHWLQDRKTYPRSSFSNAAHAQNLADKLNQMFDTDQYTIRKMQ